MPTPAPTGRPLRIAILGFGNVGSAVARLLQEQRFPGVELTAVYNRNVAAKRVGASAASLSSSLHWTDSIEEILTGNADILVETIGAVDPIESWLLHALRSGKHIVTANKQLIAYRGSGLLNAAREANRSLLFNAAVAGGVPVIPAILHGLQGDCVTRVSGILNGTCNFILSHMEQGEDYSAVLRQAQEAGYAETDPAADVNGLDARAKLCILARIAMQADIDPDSVPAETISTVRAIDFHYARELNCTVRQISRAELDGDRMRARVAPMLVPRTSPVSLSHGTQNMVVTSGRYGGDVVLSGHGAGARPTAVAVVSDLLSIAHGSTGQSLPVIARAVSGEFLAPHYLRFIVRDKPGIVSAIAGALAEANVNIDSLLQRPGYPKSNLPFVVITEPCLTSTVARAVKAIAQMPTMLEPPLCLQMLTEDDKAED